eukprot:scaffold102593_cov31-Tisochrysis_lutea.AAC.1
MKFHLSRTRPLPPYCILCEWLVLLIASAARLHLSCKPQCIVLLGFNSGKARSRVFLSTCVHSYISNDSDALTRPGFGEKKAKSVKQVSVCELIAQTWDHFEHHVWSV